MTNIYEQHRAAFPNVSAYVILENGVRVATIAIKFPRDGAERLWAYVHWIGAPMVRAYAGGGGYDKGTFAIEKAAKLIDANQAHDCDRASCERFIAAFRDAPDGHDWTHTLRNSGYVVAQAV